MGGLGVPRVHHPKPSPLFCKRGQPLCKGKSLQQQEAVPLGTAEFGDVSCDPGGCGSSQMITVSPNRPSSERGPNTRPGEGLATWRCLVKSRSAPFAVNVPPPALRLAEVPPPLSVLRGAQSK